MIPKYLDPGYTLGDDYVPAAAATTVSTSTVDSVYERVVFYYDLNGQMKVARSKKQKAIAKEQEEERKEAKENSVVSFYNTEGVYIVANNSRQKKRARVQEVEREWAEAKEKVKEKDIKKATAKAKEREKEKVKINVKERDPLTATLIDKESYQHIRALPVKAGGFIIFTHRIMHWGSKGRRSYDGEPRISLSVAFSDPTFEAPYFICDGDHGDKSTKRPRPSLAMR